jgi:hypothetical protein
VLHKENISFLSSARTPCAHQAIVVNFSLFLSLRVSSCFPISSIDRLTDILRIQYYSANRYIGLDILSAQSKQVVYSITLSSSFFYMARSVILLTFDRFFRDFLALGDWSMMEEPPKKQNMLESISIKYILQFSFFSCFLSQKKTFNIPHLPPFLSVTWRIFFIAFLSSVQFSAGVAYRLAYRNIRRKEKRLEGKRRRFPWTIDWKCLSWRSPATSSSSVPSFHVRIWEGIQ